MSLPVPIKLIKKRWIIYILLMIIIFLVFVIWNMKGILNEQKTKILSCEDRYDNCLSHYVYTNNKC